MRSLPWNMPVGICATQRNKAAAAASNFRIAPLHTPHYLRTATMKTRPPGELRREEILALAQEAKLMIVDGGMSYLNDMATDKELMVFARLLEERRRGNNEQTSV